jgi:hypothetical protein
LLTQDQLKRQRMPSPDKACEIRIVPGAFADERVLTLLREHL